jgi:dTMP kinase
VTGRFISFEGGEGAGKSTQVRLLAERLRGEGVEVVITREPGGTPGAEEIRALLVTGETDRWEPRAEALLMNAARSDHVARAVRPALARGAWVVTDRYADSTFVYQGVAKGLPEAELSKLHDFATGGLWPDLTFVLDCEVAQGLGRTADRPGAEHRFERYGAAFHEQVRAAFRLRAATNPRRCRLIDGACGIEEVAERVWTEVRQLL